MADTAAHLVDRVFPIVAVRQWVLSLPFALRYRMAYDRHLTSDVLNVFVGSVVGPTRRRVGLPDPIGPLDRLALWTQELWALLAE